MPMPRPVFLTSNPFFGSRERRWVCHSFHQRQMKTAAQTLPAATTKLKRSCFLLRNRNTPLEIWFCLIVVVLVVVAVGEVLLLNLLSYIEFKTFKLIIHTTVNGLRYSITPE